MSSRKKRKTDTDEDEEWQANTSTSSSQDSDDENSFDLAETNVLKPNFTQTNKLTADIQKTPCKYGAACFRKNAQHLNDVILDLC